MKRLESPVTPEVGLVTKAIGTAGESWKLTDIIETTIGKQYEFTKLTPTGRLSQVTQRFPEQQVKALPELAIPKAGVGMSKTSYQPKVKKKTIQITKRKHSKTRKTTKKRKSLLAGIIT